MIDTSNQVKNTTTLGRFGEEIAIRFLRKKGYNLLSRNYHIQGGELDLIMEKNGKIVFAEVKLRSSGRYGTGLDALTQTKKRKLLRTIFTFLENQKDRAALHVNSPQWQLDVIDILYDKNKHTAFIRHIPNILEA